MASVNISDDLHRKLKIYCAKKDIKIKDFVEGVIKKAMKGGE